ncbi:MgtC/SapB family protein [Thermostilla marina]
MLGLLAEAATHPAVSHVYAAAGQAAEAVGEMYIDPVTDLSDVFRRLGLGLLLGGLVGLQREHSESDMPGLRTFPLLTLLGSVSALLALTFGGWVLFGGFAGLAFLLFFPNWVRVHRESPDPGLTTSVAVLVMFGVGALVMIARIEIAIAIGAGVAVLLQFKPEMHRFAERLGNEDIKAIMQFALISGIILPILPNRTFGPYDVLNPFNIWLMVVLIVGMSLAGYIIYKFWGADAGILLGGVLGGAISSTATTVSYAQRTKSTPRLAEPAAVIVMVASTVLFARVFLEISLVNAEMLKNGWLPLTLLAAMTLLPALVIWRRVHQEAEPMPEQKNPTHLRPAIIFALVYAVMLVLLAAVKELIGPAGLYPVAAISGLTEMDAITLSVARMALKDENLLHEGWRLIAVAAVSNMVSKAFLAGVLGSREFQRKLIVLFAIPGIGGLALAFLWP